MDEHELHDYIDRVDQRVADPRPLDAVLRRSQHLRRRRRTGRRVGTGAALTVVLGVGALVVGSRQADDVRTIAPGEAGTPATPLLCPDLAGSPTSTEIPGSEADPVRYLPSVLPGDREITDAKAWRSPGECADGPLLVLQADGGDATVEATMALHGPYDGPLTDWSFGDTSETTELRGVTARQWTRALDGQGNTATTFVWTDAAGATWWLHGMVVDAATLRQVAESLVLDGAGTPPVELPEAAVPAGYEVVWRADVLPATLDPVGTETLWWIVTFGSPGPDGCSLRVNTVAPGASPHAATVTAGQERRTIRGQEALTYPGSISWEEPTGVRMMLVCPYGTDVDTMAQVAESLAPVAPDDPRLPGN